jgi:dTDP-4-amino-4,6-dideoxygalactose transaminase
VSKATISELAFLGGVPLFSAPRSTSSLFPPDASRFLSYSRIFFDQRRYTNDGPLVQSMEHRLARFHDVKHCVAFCSGFWALVIAMKCMALEGRTEVVMPSLTYRRMADVAVWANLTPHFCDVSAESLAATPETIAPCISERTALILGVHPIVNCCDAAAIEELARHKRLPLLIYSVESVYETVAGRKVGSFGGAEVFSLHASKLMNGFEGGYITTQNEVLAARLIRMRAFGFFGQDNIEELGINAKLNEIHAAMALSALDGLENEVSRNKSLYQRYRHLLSVVTGLRLVRFDESESCSFKSILVEICDEWPFSRDQTVSLLNAEGILARAYYSPPLHTKSTVYSVIAPPLPITEQVAKRYMLLPCGHFVTVQDVTQIVDLLRFMQVNATPLCRQLGRVAGAAFDIR